MAQLAIRGHATRGREVIELLEMLGGEKANDSDGRRVRGFYYINNEGQILNSYGSGRILNLKCFSLEDFLVRFPYKVGDKVIYKSEVLLIIGMKWDCFHNIVIYTMRHDYGVIDCYDNTWMKPYKEETMEEDINYCKTGKITTVIFQEQNYEDKVELDLGDNYEIKVEDGKTYVVKKKPQYPKTYEECCKTLNITALDLEILDVRNDRTEIVYSKNLDRLLNSFRKLIICRDAYWKIAGEQMGLGKPWEPDYTNTGEKKFSIWVDFGEIKLGGPFTTTQMVLSFPTKGMRDAFYENFKNLIESCDELL